MEKVNREPRQTGFYVESSDLCYSFLITDVQFPRPVSFFGNSIALWSVSPKDLELLQPEEMFVFVMRPIHFQQRTRCSVLILRDRCYTLCQTDKGL